MLRHFACLCLRLQCPPPLPKATRRFGAPSSPHIAMALLHLWDASSQEEEESREGEAGSALGGSGPPGGLVPLCLSTSHPVLVVLQGGVGSPAVLEELRVWRCPRTLALGWGTCALALQGVDSL